MSRERSSSESGGSMLPAIAVIGGALALAWLNQDAVGHFLYQTGLLPPPGSSGGLGSADASSGDVATSCAPYAHLHIASIQEAGGYRFGGPPTVSCNEFVYALNYYHSPAAPYAAQMYDELIKSKQNPAAYLADFWMESRYATDGSVAAAGQNMGNMKSPWNSTYPVPHIGPDADFSHHGGWMEGLRQEILMNKYWETHNRSGSDSVSAVLQIITPPSENNTSHFIAGVQQTMADLYQASLRKP